jgi:hypothetical protein
MDELHHPAIAVANQTCHGCPEQWEGQLKDGRHFYFRYRHGSAGLGIGLDPAAAVEDWRQPESPRIEHGDRGWFESNGERDAVFAELYELRIVAEARATGRSDVEALIRAKLKEMERRAEAEDHLPPESQVGYREARLQLAYLLLEVKELLRPPSESSAATTSPAAER